MKNRILLFLFFTFHALVALISPRPGMEMVRDHNEAEKRRQEAARAANARVGDIL